MVKTVADTAHWSRMGVGRGGAGGGIYFVEFYPTKINALQYQ